MALDPSIKVIGFDMDGTLMDTTVDYVRLAHIVMDEFVDLGVPEEEIEKDAATDSMMHGIAWLRDNDPQSLIGFEKRVGERATKIEMEHSDIAKPYEGAEQTVRLAINKGFHTAVLTRGGRTYATTLLARFCLLDLFENLVARDDFAYKEAKPSPKAIEHMIAGMDAKPSEVLYIGDGKTDWETAKNSGTSFIGVETHMDRKAWEALGGPEIVTIPTVADLAKML